MCAAIAHLQRDAVWEAFCHASYAPSPGTTAHFAQVLTAIDAADIAALDEPTLRGCLSDTVAVARYWQEPDEFDQALATSEVVAALRPIAVSLLSSVASTWWSSSMDPARQVAVQWADEPVEDPPRLMDFAESLRDWRRRTVDAEREAHTQPADPAAPISGTWWSSPALSGVALTSRSLPELGSAQLVLAEDDLGWRRARLWPVTPLRECRVYEIAHPQSWIDLVNAYPLRVTRSRLHDWWRTTGRAGEWFIPDWEAVSVDYDAVHLPVLGYLSVAGRALDVDEGATVLAGWDPDATFWLRDVLRAEPGPSIWLRDANDPDARWLPEARPR